MSILPHNKEWIYISNLWTIWWSKGSCETHSRRSIQEEVFFFVQILGLEVTWYDCVLTSTDVSSVVSVFGTNSLLRRFSFWTILLVSRVLQTSSSPCATISHQWKLNCLVVIYSTSYILYWWLKPVTLPNLCYKFCKWTGSSDFESPLLEVWITHIKENI